MSVVQIDTEVLKAIVKESVAEAIKADRFRFFEGMTPSASSLEMQDIIKQYGEKPENFEYVDVSDWFSDEN